MAARYNWELPQKQPASAVVIAIFKALIAIFKAVWPLALALFFSQRRESRSEKLLFTSVVIISLGIVYAIFEFFFFRFFISGNELTVRKGFLNKREIILPLDRIQAVHLEQDWLHRMLNIVKVTVDSPGSSKAEVKFSLRRDMAEALRNHILRESGYESNGVTMDETMPQAIIVLSGSDLLKLGISSNFLKAFFIMLAFLTSMLDNLEGITGKQSADWMMWAEDQATSSSAGVLAAFAAFVLIISVLVSFAMVVLKYGNFRMDCTEKGFHIKSGLLNRREKAVPFKKIQFISWKANWIRRHIPYYLLQFHAIGEKQHAEKLDINVPVTRPAFLDPLLQPYHPALREGTRQIRIHASYVVRKTLIIFYFCLALFLALYFFNGLQALWAFLPLPFFIVNYFIFRRKFYARVSATAVQVNKEIFGKEIILLRWDKIQSVTITQSLFQVRKQLANLKMNTAGGVVKIPFIPLEKARELGDYALYVVEINKEN